jgi:hypothetical protein
MIIFNILYNVFLIIIDPIQLHYPIQSVLDFHVPHWRTPTALGPGVFRINWTVLMAVLKICHLAKIVEQDGTRMVAMVETMC